MASGLSHEEIRRRIDETGRKRDEALSWLETTLAERLQRGATGRVVVEIFTEEGYAKRLRVSQDDNLDDNGPATKEWVNRQE